MRKKRGYKMRGLAIVIASFGLFATAVQAADKAGPDIAKSPAVTQFPDTSDNFHVYMFTLRKNEISYEKSGEEFCAELHYGKAVLVGPRSEAVKGDKVVEELEWVICGYKNY
jgi:hypothetical protein